MAEEITRVAASRAPKVEKALVDAAGAYNRGRAQDAWRILRPLTRDLPDVSAIRELAGLALYRLGRWKAAAQELEEFRRLTGSVEQHPVLADCYRAVGRFKAVAKLWDELRTASPGPELMNEGRIVAAGARADQGDLRGAIELLEMGPVRAKRAPKMHDLRLWYALADLYERAGDAPRAREWWTRVVKADASMADAAERLQALQ